MKIQLISVSVYRCINWQGCSQQTGATIAYIQRHGFDFYVNFQEQIRKHIEYEDEWERFFFFFWMITSKWVIILMCFLLGVHAGYTPLVGPKDYFLLYLYRNFIYINILKTNGRFKVQDRNGLIQVFQFLYYFHRF